MCVGKERRVDVCHHRVFVIRGMNHVCFRYATFPFEAEDQGCFIERRFYIGYPKLLVEGGGGGEVCMAGNAHTLPHMEKLLRHASR